MRSEFDVSAAVVAQFGPSVLRRYDVGVGDTNLGRGQKRTSSASQLGILPHLESNGRNQLTVRVKGWFRRKMDDIAKAGHPYRGWKWVTDGHRGPTTIGPT